MLKLTNISKSYTTGTFTQQALKDVNLEFRKSEFVAILGPSGSGKTTMLNIIGGLDRYDSGDLIINDKSTKRFRSQEWDAYRNNCIGFVFQSYNLISHISILDNVQMGMTLSGVGPRKRKRKALELLEKVGLTEHAHKKPNQLSGGQMQRVAIARALANDPDVILADEPTGALDSKTSVQIMALIQEIAKDKLVIMVTHNKDIAEKYATRVVTFKDGELITDTMPIKKDEEVKEPYHIKKTAMSLLTALKLSFNNIVTKKGRTLITAFASSIGIIGIALILSLSNGFDKQIDKFEQETLSSFPLIISKTALDLSEETMMNAQSDHGKTENSYTDKKFIYPFDPTINQIRHENKFTKDYIDYVDKIDKELISAIGYTRAVGLNILAKTGDKVVTTARSGNNPMASMMSTFVAIPKTLNEKSNYITNNYDILQGRLPKEKEELILQVDNKNRLSKDIIKLLDLNPKDEQISFDKIIGKEFKLVLNDDYYIELGEFFTINQNLEELYNSKNAVTLKIVGIMRANEDNKLSAEGFGIGYTEDLVDYVIEKNTNSKIGQKQLNSDFNVLTGQKFDLTTEEGIETKDNLVAYLGASSIPFAISIYPKDFASKENITAYLDIYNNDIAKATEPGVQKYLDSLKKTVTSVDDSLLSEVDEALEQDVKIKLVNLTYENEKIDGTIQTERCEFKVTDSVIVKSNCGVSYTDYAATIISLSGNIMDAVTIVLIAFSAISLVVSSIMIGIITYISVLERTKEIGILRALGARKKDISRVFNAETFIIGISSGVIGIGIALLLTIPANIVIYNLTELSNVAKLNPLHAILLIIVSMTLTLIGGLIPANMASKKDPVEALRTE